LILLALSIAGLGDLHTVSERLACRMAGPGCTATRQRDFPDARRAHVTSDRIARIRVTELRS
jgi:hypothetical protein